MFQSIGDNEIIDPQNNIIAHYLVKNLLVDSYIGSFILNYCQWLQVVVIHHGIASTRHVVELYHRLVFHKREGVAFVMDKIIEEALSDPLLGSEEEVSLSDLVENIDFSIGFLQFWLEYRQV